MSKGGERVLDTLRIESLLQDFFADRDLGIVSVYLYGSVARESARPESDVDVAVLYQNAPEASLRGLPLALEADLEQLLGMPVQVVALNAAPVDLVHRVLRDGRLVLEDDPSARVAFEVTARNEYFDLLPHLERYRLAGGASS